MDKVREVKRGTSRFSPTRRPNKQSGRRLASALNSGGDDNVDLLERPKKEKVLSVVGKASSSNEDSEMGGGSEGEEEHCRAPPPASSAGGCKKLRLHRKPFDDCNAVDPAAVPRKLRSAMQQKRNRESISPPKPDAKKPHSMPNGIESRSKKYKQNLKQVGDSEQSPSQAGPITKDEEEVVETLYALATLMPNNKPIKGTTHQKSTESAECSIPVSKATKEPENAPRATTAEVTNISSNGGGSPGDLARDNPLRQSAIPEGSCILEGQKFDLGSDSSLVAQAIPPGQERTDKSNPEYIDIKLLCKASSLDVPSELRSEARVMQSKVDVAQACGRKTESMLWPAAAVSMKPEQHHPINENMDSGKRLACKEGALSLWPGLCTSGSCGGGIRSPLERPSSTKAPFWLDAATCLTRPDVSVNGVLTEKALPGIVDRRKSWKKCAAHVYISRLIRAYQNAEKSVRFPVLPDQLKVKEETRSGGVRNGLSGATTSSSNTYSYAAGKSLNEALNGIQPDKMLQQDQQQTSVATEILSSQKLNCDFLSLSAGYSGLESNSNNNKNKGKNTSNNNPIGNGLESPTQLRPPYLHSLVQPPLVPFSFPPNRYSNCSPYTDQLTAATAAQQVQLQIPQYLGNPFYGLQYPGHAGPAKQQMWAAHLAGIPGCHLSKWQNGIYDSTSQVSSHAVLSTSSPPLEVIGAKFPPSTQQQLFPVSSSLSSNMVRRQQHHPPGGYDQGGGGFRTNSSSQLQILCNAEQL
uniref:Uncharacterized protein n=1 Tax=Nelumbo nucifera TaxID=4432 RepID=A0A822Z495_NELNU|nr:TPA_asm: hypothetical protein HUJ06_015487 [Nelumbo nucifera]